MMLWLIKRKQVEDSDLRVKQSEEAADRKEEEEMPSCSTVPADIT